MTATEERARLDLATDILMRVMGRRPAGWFCLPRQDDPFAGGTISPHTMDLLIDAGYEYMGNGLADDVPHYWVTDFAARRAMLTLPYYYHFDDQWFLLFPRKGTGLEHADDLFRNWRAEFDAQYRRGRQFSMVLHPGAVGWCNRLQLLEDFLTHLRSFPGVWNPTSACARYWQATYPAGRLEAGAKHLVRLPGKFELTAPVIARSAATRQSPSVVRALRDGLLRRLRLLAMTGVVAPPIRTAPGR